MESELYTKMEKINPISSKLNINLIIRYSTTSLHGRQIPSGFAAAANKFIPNAERHSKFHNPFSLYTRTHPTHTHVKIITRPRLPACFWEYPFYFLPPSDANTHNHTEGTNWLRPPSTESELKYPLNWSFKVEPLVSTTSRTGLSPSPLDISIKCSHLSQYNAEERRRRKRRKISLLYFFLHW